jgi:hypothetical protein
MRSGVRTAQYRFLSAACNVLRAIRLFHVKPMVRSVERLSGRVSAWAISKLRELRHALSASPRLPPVIMWVRSRRPARMQGSHKPHTHPERERERERDRASERERRRGREEERRSDLWADRNVGWRLMFHVKLAASSLDLRRVSSISRFCRSLGETPGILLACPKVLGRSACSLSRASYAKD